MVMRVTEREEALNGPNQGGGEGARSQERGAVTPTTTISWTVSNPVAKKRSKARGGAEEHDENWVYDWVLGPPKSLGCRVSCAHWKSQQD